MAQAARFAPSLCRAFIAVAFIPLTLPAFAQSILGTPDAGQSMREMEAAPLTLPSDSGLRLDTPVSEESAVADGGATLLVQSFTLSGNQAFGDTQLLSLLEDLKGRQISLA